MHPLRLGDATRGRCPLNDWCLGVATRERLTGKIWREKGYSLFEDEQFYSLSAAIDHEVEEGSRIVGLASMTIASLN